MGADIRLNPGIKTQSNSLHEQTWCAFYICEGRMNSSNGIKRKIDDSLSEVVSPKRLKALPDYDASEGDDSDTFGDINVPEEELSDGGQGFHINEEYARRFEHNKKREELQRCEYPELHDRTESKVTQCKKSMDKPFQKGLKMVH